MPAPMPGIGNKKGLAGPPSPSKTVMHVCLAGRIAMHDGGQAFPDDHLGFRANVRVFPLVDG